MKRYMLANPENSCPAKKLGRGVALKVLSCAAFAGALVFGVGAAANAEENTSPIVLGSPEANNLLLEKTINETTLDYLKQNNILIPQKKYDEATRKMVDGGEPIKSPGSAYKIIEGTADNFAFEYKTADEAGNVISTYYNITLSSPLSETGEGVALCTSKNIQWTKLDTAPTEGTTDTITIKYSDNSTDYYKYELVSGDYEIVTSNMTNPTGDITNKVFLGISIRAISNYGTIGNITGDFINNSSSGSGGAISNGVSTIGNITGDFINNSVSGSKNSHGGAIDNSGTIGNITGDFINNSVSGSRDIYGGAISNGVSSAIGNITGDFINNSVSGSSSGSGGAISNNGRTIGNITGDFINNSVSVTSYGYGGAIDNIGTIGNITGDFINNSVSGSRDIYGGAIYNCTQTGSIATIGNITGDFINNSISGYGDGGAIYNFAGTIGNITGDFINNSAGNGGAISNNGGTIGNIMGDFINNSADYGGAIYNNGGTIGNIMGDFINNSVMSGGITYGGAIRNIGTIGNITGDFINNSATGYVFGYGGAIYNEGILGEIVNSSFIGNYVNFRYAGADGGAIYSKSPLNITADNGVSEFTGNYIQKEANGEKEYQAIYAPTVNFTSKNNGRVIMNDKMNIVYSAGMKLSGHTVSVNDVEYQIMPSGTEIKTVYNPELNISGDMSGLVQINNDVESIGGENSIVKAIMEDKLISNGSGGFYTPAGSDVTLAELRNDYLEISLTNTNLHLGVRDNVIDGHNLTLNSGLMSMQNNAAGVAAMYKVTVTGNTDFVADVNLAAKEMDRFTAQEYGNHTGNLNVIGMNLLSEPKSDEAVTAVYFAEPGLKNNVTLGLSEVPTNKYQNIEVYTPIYKYNVAYDKEHEYDGKGDGGYFLFTKGDKYITSGGGTVSTGNASDAFNPAVLTAPVSSVAASQATINETFKYVFEHADAFTQLPAMERTSQMEANKYALSTDFNDNLNLHDHGSLCIEHNNQAVWTRPYSTFESINLKHGPKVDAITYGTLIGYDGDFKEMKDGWHRLGTAYIGYNGSQLNYNSNDTTMNGGLVGGTETFYKGNFWTALTASAGASVGETHTMYGKEDFTTLLAGVGSKTGYNFEFKEGKYILQPIMFLSYTFVNTFDYTNAAGVKINSSPAHNIQINPSVRFTANLKHGWQPYASAGMVWNVMNQSDVKANGVKLPEMSMKPYVEYGLGVQRNWKDKFTAYGQAMLRNGGRNGIALTAGFRWAIGDDGDDKHVKVKSTVTGAASPATTRTVVKQLRR